MKGSLIKQNRKLRDLTLEGLSKGICSVSYLSKIENNTIQASEKIYRLLGERLGIRLIDINQEFDEEIHQTLLSWHEASQLRDFTLMDHLKNKCEIALQENHNIDLLNLFKVIAARHHMTKTNQLLDNGLYKELEGLLVNSTNEYQFFYHKVIGLHYFLKFELKTASQHFLKSLSLLNQISYNETEIYFHLSLTYSHTRQFVESNVYGKKAIEGYKKSLNYSKIVDSIMVIAINYNRMNAHTIAEKYFLDLLKMAKYQLKPLEKRRVFHNLGAIYIHQEKYDLAFDYLKRASSIETDENILKSNTTYLLALTCYYNGDIEKSKEFLASGAVLAEKYNHIKYKHKLFTLKCRMNNTMHEDFFLQKLENQIIPDLKQSNDFEDYRYFLELLAKLCFEKRLYKKSATYFKKANSINHSPKKDLL
ncbi:helix-turn-helix domain-containing protein [Halobacillus mangrovi]|uniref:Transcriptional regulator n=1 Tax=Halobacillus mangrovi TaxID=402384 RepID=A0A1W5ZRH8_9BACI|nr:helix-turn-helix domain-containing protein [Halobacillus mangrovi]ARI75889.1 transcriptional regulator [Halobacillus mangrovi]